MRVQLKDLQNYLQGLDECEEFLGLERVLIIDTNAHSLNNSTTLRIYLGVFCHKLHCAKIN